MSWLKAVAAGFFLAAQITTSITTSLAADMPKGYPRESLPMPAPPRVTSFELNSGWYVRGDLGYGWGRLNGAQAATGFPPDPSSNSLGNGMTGGLGVGIKRDWIQIGRASCRERVYACV